MLHEFLAAHAEEIVIRSWARVAGRKSPAPTPEDLKNGPSLFLAQLIDSLKQATGAREAIGHGATVHGGELLALGFTVSDVIHGYGDIGQVITRLADERDVPITPGESRLFHACLDDAIAHAVTEYERLRDESVASDCTQRLAVLAHDLRNRLSAAMVAYSILQPNMAGVDGSTGAVLGRSLKKLRDLVDNSVANVRLDARLGEQRRVSVAEAIAEAKDEASLGRGSGDAGLVVGSVPPDVQVVADPHILSSTLVNLLQNAFQFGRPAGKVAVRTSATAERVVIEVEDECGGLPPGRTEDLFRAFAPQRSGKRAGLGLGLFSSRRGVEAMGGSLGVRNLPGHGCVFSIELPRAPAA